MGGTAKSFFKETVEAKVSPAAMLKWVSGEGDYIMKP